MVASEDVAPDKERWYQDTEAKWGLLFVLPVVIIFLVLRVIPALGAFYLSFTRYSILKPPEWIGLEHYLNLLSDTAFHQALFNSLYYMVGTIFPSAAIALVIALLLDQKMKGVAFYRTAYYIPQIASWVAISMIWIYMFNPSFGVINYILSFFGIPKLGWLNDVKLALPSIIIVGIWRNLGYNVVIYLAGLQGIPAYLYEAAVIDGASRWRQFWRITWPLLLPTTVFILIITGIFALQAFDQIFVLTQGGPADATVTVVFSIYRNAFHYLKMGYASAMAFVLFVVIFILSALSLRLSGQLGE